MAIKFPFGYLAFYINYLLKSLSKKEPKLKALSAGSLSILEPHFGQVNLYVIGRGISNYPYIIILYWEVEGFGFEYGETKAIASAFLEINFE